MIKTKPLHNPSSLSWTRHSAVGQDTADIVRHTLQIPARNGRNRPPRSIAAASMYHNMFPVVASCRRGNFYIQLHLLRRYSALPLSNIYYTSFSLAAGWECQENQKKIYTSLKKSLLPLAGCLLRVSPLLADCVANSKHRIKGAS